MAGFSELIKDLEKVRDYYRDFYLYGFKSKDDFTQRSTRTFEDEKRRAELLFPEHLGKGFRGRKKTFAIPVNCNSIYENPFYNVYSIKSFTDNDIRLHFLLCDILRGGGKMTVTEIVDLLTGRFGDITGSCGEPISERTVRGKLDEYAEEGIFVKETVGRKKLYSLSHDDIDDFFAEYDGLLDAVSFFSEEQRFGVIGSYILKALGRKNEHFLMKHNYIVHTLDDEIALAIAEAVNGRKVIEYGNFGSPDIKHTVIPFFILVSAQTGRRYLMAYDISFKRFSVSRLDRMRKARPAGDIPKSIDLDKLRAQAKTELKRVFGVSFGSSRESKAELFRVKLVIFVDEKNESFIIDRIFREKRLGKAERTGENEYTLTFEVYDPAEMLPWVRSFIGRIISFECENGTTSELFRSDLKKMYEMYHNNGEEDGGNGC